MEFNFYKKTFSIDEARQLNPLVMAFVGDAVFELIVRTHLTDSNTELSAHKLHVKAISYVKAHAQSEFMKEIEAILTEEEITIYKRGRNTKSATVPKNADVQEYRIATGFEALIGYLYLTNQEKRLYQILSKILMY
jgi:ribonuclease III family protein